MLMFAHFCRLLTICICCAAFSYELGFLRRTEKTKTTEEGEHVTARRELFKDSDEEGLDEKLKKAKHE